MVHGLESGQSGNKKSASKGLPEKSRNELKVHGAGSERTSALALIAKFIKISSSP